MSENFIGSKGTSQPSAAAVSAKQHLASSFFKKGITVAIISGMSYGLYTAFVGLAMSKGIWEKWSIKDALPFFVSFYILGALGSALNDSMSAIWAWIFGGVNGKISDFFRCLKSKPGRKIGRAHV